jgi:nitroimidazol reductase NimA-like FMN-containing flavoprotein (pyridoxamine 5'-phosphate oxidase superfamily)
MIKDLTEERISDLLQRNYVGSMGFIAHSAPYVLPVTYYYDPQNQSIISYSMEGHKIDSLRESPEVSLLVFEQDTMDRWRSALIHGTFEELEGIDAKFYLKEFSEGIQKLMAEKGLGSTHFIDEFSSKSESEGIPLVYRIRISDWSGKYREG